MKIIPMYVEAAVPVHVEEKDGSFYATINCVEGSIVVSAETMADALSKIRDTYTAWMEANVMKHLGDKPDINREFDHPMNMHLGELLYWRDNPSEDDVIFNLMVRNALAERFGIRKEVACESKEF